MESGRSANIAMGGGEGIVGTSLFMGGDSTPSRAVVQNAALGFRVDAHMIKQEFNNAAPVLYFLLRYSQALITQMAQTAACNKHHSIYKQLRRWLLMSLDRLVTNELVTTPRLIANMLVVSLDDMSESARPLRKAGVINYSGGRITILERSGLEELSCECYEVVRKEYDRLLPAAQAS